jgi:hypothetical protein
MTKDADPLVFSPVRHRYSLAAQRIASSEPIVLDVGGYKSRRRHLEPFFRKLDYTSVNVGPAWYPNDEPDHNSSIPFVICVDTLEHIPAADRATSVHEIIRVAGSRAIIVVPIAHADTPDEYYLLKHSKRFRVKPMPSLVEHLKYGLPKVLDLKEYTKAYDSVISFAVPCRKV